MTNKLRHHAINCTGAALTAALLLTLSAGCAFRRDVGLHLVSYHDAQHPQPARLDLDRRTYRVESNGDFRLAASTYRGENDDDFPLGQYLDLHIYWKPRPGRTTADSSTANALVRYLIATEDGAAVYSGTGFALPSESHGRLTVKLESFYLRLERVTGTINDVLGDCQLEGRIKATRDSGTTTQTLRELDRLATR